MTQPQDPYGVPHQDPPPAGTPQYDPAGPFGPPGPDQTQPRRFPGAEPFTAPRPNGPQQAGPAPHSQLPLSPIIVPVRPGYVTATVVLTWLAVLAGAGSLTFLAILAVDSSSTDDGDTIAAIMVAVFGLFSTVGMAVASLFLLKGHNWARIVSFVYFGIGLLCTGLFSGVGTVSGTTEGFNGVDDWLALVLFLATFFTFVLAIVMLVLPSVNAWFREMTLARRAGVR